MDITEKTFLAIQNKIEKFFVGLDIKKPIIKLERSDDFQHGDVSTNAVLKYGKVLKKDPYLLAQDVVNYLSKKPINYVEKIEAVRPGFINIFFTKEFFELVIKEAIKSGDNFGKNKLLKSQKWVVEHTSPNPNKAMHLGHLRNNLIGMSLVRILSWSGANVVSDAVDNNRGIAIAKLMWGFLAHMRKSENTPIDVEYWSLHPEQWFSPKEKEVLPDIFVTQCYVLGESDFKNDTITENKIRQFVIRWEAHDKNIWKLWSFVLNYAYEGINKTLNRLGSNWDKVWHEHEHYENGRNFILKGVKKGIFKKLPDGAILTDLSKYNLSDTILLKSDGTSLYITQDIALTALKKKFYKADKLIWVIGPEQSLAMKQLFAVCDQLGIGKLEDFTHVSYGYVGLKNADGGFKKMSSREGTVVLIDDVIDIAKNKIFQKFTAEGKQSDDYLNDLSEKMALAAVKFSILKPERNQDIIFDVEKSIETKGDSGIYVLYTYVRIQSLLVKNKISEKVVAVAQLGQEGDLIRLLMFFPEVIKKSKDDFSTHHVAHYLLEVCSSFNAWYAKETILDNSDKQNYKIAIAKAVAIVIKNGLSILGIETVNHI